MKERETREPSEEGFSAQAAAGEAEQMPEGTSAQADRDLLRIEADAALREEHRVLGARSHDCTGWMLVDSYDANASGENLGDLEATCAGQPTLCDVSAYGLLRVSGSDAQRFLQTMTSGEVAALSSTEVAGECCRALILTSEAEVIDEVTIARTGPEEYLLLSFPTNVDEVVAWLTAHAALEDDTGPLFPDLALSDETTALAVFALYGEGADDVVLELGGDFLGEVPADDSIRLVTFDGLPAMLLAESLGGDELLFRMCVPQAMAVLLWRLLLSFPEVDPVAFPIYQAHLTACGFLFSGIDQERYLDPFDSGTEYLLRDEGGFVGARAYEALRLR